MATAANPSSSLPALKRALLRIHHSHPRLIASPPIVTGAPTSGASRRASVAIIIRLRPRDGSPSFTASPTSTAAASPAPASPFTAHLPLHASPPKAPSSPALVPSTSSSSNVPNSDSALASASLVTSTSSTSTTTADQLEELFNQPWVKASGTTAEILFIKRATRSTDKWSGHVAFPGGRQEPEDEDGRYTAMRETWEEVGIDLAEKEWIPVGALDDREITTSLGKRLLMILSCYVFVHTSPHSPIPELQDTEVASAHWIPLEQLTAPKAKVGVVSIDISTRLAPRNALARVFLKALVGSMHFKCILLPNHPVGLELKNTPLPNHPLPDLKLWGLTLGMTLDLLTHMNPSVSILPTNEIVEKTPNLSTYPYMASKLPQSQEEQLIEEEHPFAPSAASIFPRFSYPDINLLIYIFGFRYRRILRYRPSAPGENARVNWAGMTLGSYYAAVRRALVVAVVLRGCAALGALAWGIALVRRKLLERNRLMRVSV